MAKVITKARQARLDYSARIGRTVTVEEAARELGIDRKRLTQIELNRWDSIDRETMLKMAKLYGVKQMSDLFDLDPDGIRTPSYADKVLAAA